MKEELYRLIRSSGVNRHYAETATEMILSKYTLTPKSEAVGCGRVTINEVGEKDICDDHNCPDCQAKQKPFGKECVE